jgi:transcriptional regulator with XRE-family HTH domain
MDIIKKILKNEKKMTQEEMKAFGQRIINLRKYLKASQIEFANTLGVSHSFISSIESGKNKPGYTFFKNLYLQYHVNPEYLFEGRGDMILKSKKENAPEKKDYGEFNDRIHEMLYYIENVPLVKLSVLQFFTTFLFDNKAHIEIDMQKHQEYQKKKRERET